MQAASEAQKFHTAAKIERLLGGSASGRTVAIRVHDPKALPNFRSIFSDQIACFDDEFDCLTGADCAVILTEWNAYRNLDLPRAAALLRTPLLIDTRNVLDPADARDAGFVYSGAGR